MSWTDEEIFEYWEHPDTRELIINAVPVEKGFLEEPLVKEVHDEASLAAAKLCLELGSSDNSSGPDQSDPVEDKKLTQDPHLSGPDQGELVDDKLTYHSGPDEVESVSPDPVDDKKPHHKGPAKGEPVHHKKTHHRGPAKGEPVDDKKLTEYPYHSVGRLFNCHPGTTQIFYYASAFYIGKNRIATAAHALHSTKEQKSGTIKGGAWVFVPAMKDKKDVYGRHGGGYGYFIVHSWKWHPRFNPTGKCWHYEYDIAIADVKINQHRKSIDEVKGKDRVKLTPIELDRDRKIDCTTTWKVLGYPGEGKNDGKMIQVTGKYKKATWSTKDQNMTESSIGLIYMKHDVAKGISGGPWMIESSTKKGVLVANGNCVMGDQDEHHSASPYYSTKLLSELKV